MLFDYVYEMALRTPGRAPHSSLFDKAYLLYKRKGLTACAREAASYGLFKNRLVGKLWKPADLLRYRYRRYKDPTAFSDANPYKLISVSPADIVYKFRLDGPNSESESFDWWDERNRVYGGPWDQQRVDFRTYHRTLYDCFEAHFLDGVPWSETEYIRTVLEQVENGTPTWHTSTSPEEVYDRCDKLDRIWESITTDGYRRQSVVNDAVDWRKDYAEITVSIARDGSFLQHGGKHRLIMARLAGVDEIPVLVIVRHRQWQQLRNEIRNGETDDYPSHPDLEDLAQSE